MLALWGHEMRKERVIKVGWPTLKVLYIMSVGVRVDPSLFIFKARGMG